MQQSIIAADVWEDNMANIREVPIKIVIPNKPKILIGLAQNGTK